MITNINDALQRGFESNEADNSLILNDSDENFTDEADIDFNSYSLAKGYIRRPELPTIPEASFTNSNVESISLRESLTNSIQNNNQAEERVLHALKNLNDNPQLNYFSNEGHETTTVEDNTENSIDNTEALYQEFMQHHRENLDNQNPNEAIEKFDSDIENDENNSTTKFYTPMAISTITSNQKLMDPVISSENINNLSVDGLEDFLEDNDDTPKKVNDSDTRQMLSHATRNLNLGAELDDSMISSSHHNQNNNNIILPKEIDNGPSGSFNLKSLELIKSRKNKIRNSLQSTSSNLLNNIASETLQTLQRTPEKQQLKQNVNIGNIPSNIVKFSPHKNLSLNNRSPKRLNTENLQNSKNHILNKKLQKIDNNNNSKNKNLSNTKKDNENDQPKKKFAFLKRKSGFTTKAYDGSGSNKKYIHPYQRKQNVPKAKNPHQNVKSKVFESLTQISAKNSSSAINKSDKSKNGPKNAGPSSTFKKPNLPVNNKKKTPLPSQQAKTKKPPAIDLKSKDSTEIKALTAPGLTISNNLQNLLNSPPKTPKKSFFNPKMSNSLKSSNFLNSNRASKLGQLVAPSPARSHAISEVGSIDTSIMIQKGESAFRESVRNTEVNDFEEFEKLAFDSQTSILSSTPARVVSGNFAFDDVPSSKNQVKRAHNSASNTSTVVSEKDQSPIKISTISPSKNSSSPSWKFATSPGIKFNTSQEWGDLGISSKKIDNLLPTDLDLSINLSPQKVQKSRSNSDSVVPNSAPPTTTVQLSDSISQKVQQKIDQLNQEITNLQNNNKLLERAKIDLSLQEKALNKAKLALKTEYQEKFEALETHKKEEQNKIKLAQKQLEEFKNTIKAQGSRASRISERTLRDEIEGLKRKVIDIEKKNSTNVRRIKENLQNLEHENIELKEKLAKSENEKLLLKNQLNKFKEKKLREERREKGILTVDEVNNLVDSQIPSPNNKNVKKSAASTSQAVNIREHTISGLSTISAMSHLSKMSNVNGVSTLNDLKALSTGMPDSPPKIISKPAKTQHETKIEISDSEKIVEREPDGTRKIKYLGTGTTKIVETSGVITIKFQNGDVKTIFPEGFDQEDKKDVYYGFGFGKC